MARSREDSGLENAATAKRDRLLKLTQDRMGSKRAMLGDNSKLKLEVVPIDVAVIDAILGGGWKRGRMALIIGAASMGKTLLTQWTIQAFQSRGYVCGFIDPEKTYDPDWFGATGVNVEDLIVARPESMEQAFDQASEWAENDMDLIVVDSLAALTPKMRLEADLADRDTMGLQARKISEGLNLLTNKNTSSFILMTNQLRSKIGVVYGNPETMPGGEAQKYYASYIIKVKRNGWITENDRRIGYDLQVITEKNKLAPPFQKTEVPFLFTGHIDHISGLIEIAKDLGIIEYNRGYYRIDGKTLHGEKAMKTCLEESPDLVERIKTMIGDSAIAEKYVEDELILEDNG